MATLTTNKPKKLSDLLEPRFLARLDSLDVTSRKILQGRLQGERRSKRRGQSVEFADHRPYVSGDDLRFVDWNVYGRLEQLFLKLFLEEQDLTVHIALDVTASQSIGSPLKYRFAQQLAAALAYISLVHNNRLTVSCYADGITSQIANMRGRAYLPRLAELLLAQSPAGTSDFDRACSQIAAHRIGKGIMIVISDFLYKEGYQSGLRRLISNQYDLYAIQILSPQEMSPELSGDLQLIDVEDEDTAEVTVNATLIKYYKCTLAAYCSELKEFCTQRNAHYVLTDTAASVELLVLNTLCRIGLIH